MNRLEAARQSDSTVAIMKEEEIGSTSLRPAKTGMLTWHFKMKNSRDVSWTASTAFMWDAARINFPSGRKGNSMAVYPFESKRNTAYGRSPLYFKQSIEFYSNTYVTYPWLSAFSARCLDVGVY